MKRLILAVVFCLSIATFALAEKKVVKTELQKQEEQLQSLLKQRMDIMEKFNIAINRVDAVIQYLKSLEVKKK